MRVIVNQPVGTQLFFDINEPKQTTVGQIAHMVEEEEGVPVSYQLYSAGKECWANHEEPLSSFLKDDSQTIELDVTYDLDGQGGLRCETAKPSCACHFCCFEARCIKKYDCYCCCCEAGCNIM
mmetsp:Transcript_13422/g.16899  ORF Transcript_13422/g.16899 Transcript_13422/m.16899 type:complete len:123 (+) Transcript_13422:1-369(+)